MVSRWECRCSYGARECSLGGRTSMKDGRGARRLIEENKEECLSLSTARGASTPDESHPHHNRPASMRRSVFSDDSKDSSLEATIFFFFGFSVAVNAVVSPTNPKQNTRLPKTQTPNARQKEKALAAYTRRTAP